MKGICYLILGLIGACSCFLFAVYFLSLIIFIFDETIGYPGAVAFIPKWVFAFSLLIFFFKTKAVQETLEKFF